MRILRRSAHIRLDDEIWSACVADDVRAIGSLLLPLLDDLPACRGMAPRERWTRLVLRRAARRATNGEAENAGQIARWCSAAAEPFRTPIRLLHRPNGADDGVTTARRGRPRTKGESGARPRLRPVRLSLLLALVGAACGTVGIVGLFRSSPAPARPSPRVVAARRHCPLPIGPRAGKLIDVDRDGCPERVLVDGSMLEVGGTRYHLGQPGDLVEVGDWNGNGIATPALVRPSTGAIFAFDAWPSPDHPLVAHPIARVHGVTQVQVRHNANGRDGLVLDRSSGPPVPLDLDRPISRGSNP